MMRGDISPKRWPIEYEDLLAKEESSKVVTNPKYLGSWMESTLKDVRVTKA